MRRYCSLFLSQKRDLSELKLELETYVHGIELDAVECNACIQNLNEVAVGYGIQGVQWNILNADTLTVERFNGKMDYVFGNPPYVRVHNLDDSYKAVKKFKFAEGGMTDLFIVFFEIGFNICVNRRIFSCLSGSSVRQLSSSCLSPASGLLTNKWI